MTILGIDVMPIARALSFDTFFSHSAIAEVVRAGRHNIGAFTISSLFAAISLLLARHTSHWLSSRVSRQHAFPTPLILHIRALMLYIHGQHNGRKSTRWQNAVDGLLIPTISLFTSLSPLDHFACLPLI